MDDWSHAGWPPTTSHRARYLAETAQLGRSINADIERQARAATRAHGFWQVLSEIDGPDVPPTLMLYDASKISDEEDRRLADLRQRYHSALLDVSPEALHLLRMWPDRLKTITALSTAIRCGTE